jgi:hypothetical protein
MSLWEKIKNDLQKGIEESMAVINKGKGWGTYGRRKETLQTF